MCYSENPFLFFHEFVEHFLEFFIDEVIIYVLLVNLLASKPKSVLKLFGCLIVRIIRAFTYKIVTLITLVIVYFYWFFLEDYFFNFTVRLRLFEIVAPSRVSYRL